MKGLGGKSHGYDIKVEFGLGDRGERLDQSMPEPLWTSISRHRSRRQKRQPARGGGGGSAKESAEIDIQGGEYPFRRSIMMGADVSHKHRASRRTA